MLWRRADKVVLLEEVSQNDGAQLFDDQVDAALGETRNADTVAVSMPHMIHASAIA